MRSDLPPNQIPTSRWPVIGERDPEPFDAATWRLDVTGCVDRPLSLTFADLAALPHVTRHGTIHCVTRWSRAGTAFRGVALGEVLARAGVRDDARFVRFASGRGHDTSLPLDIAVDPARADILIADAASLGGEGFAPVAPEHGGPVRSVTFARYFYKSVKWLRTIEVMAEDRLGFWERTAGYHNGADPWREERYVVRGIDGATLRGLLASRDLGGRDLLSADLRGIDFSGMRLAGASLRNADLTGASLRGADLTRANFTNARLAGADLRDARIDGIDFDGADLRRADLRGARGFPASLAVAQFHTIEALRGPGAGDEGARVDGLDWSGARVDGLLPHEETWLRAQGVRLR